MLIKEHVEKWKMKKESHQLNTPITPRLFRKTDLTYLLNYSFQPPLRTHQCYSCNDFGMQDSKCPVLG